MTEEPKQDKFLQIFGIVYFSLAMTVLPYCLGKLIYYRVKADKTVQYESERLHGFDDNDDGVYDKIVAVRPFYGTRAGGFVLVSTFGRGDESFDELEQLLINGEAE